MLFIVIYFCILLVVVFAIYRYLPSWFLTRLNNRQQDRIVANNIQSFLYYLIIMFLLVSLFSFLSVYFLGHYFLDSGFYQYFAKDNSKFLSNLYFNDLQLVIHSLATNVIDSQIRINSNMSLDILLDLAHNYLHYKMIIHILSIVSSISCGVVSIFVVVRYFKADIMYYRKLENMLKVVFLLFSIIAVLTTLSLFIVLLIETVKFFQHIPVINFLFGINWIPSQAEFYPSDSFGVLPLLAGTFLISAIAVIFATIIGILVAIYMSQYMPKNIRSIVKPILEILAGIPSIIYGFFAVTVVAPFLIHIFRDILGVSIPNENALTAGLVIGIMIMPLISSISDDVFVSSPRSLKDGALALGCMQYEYIMYILLPSSLPGVLSSIILAVSRSIGETMIVVMASSLVANLTINPLEPVTTITTQIVLILQGDQEFNNPKTLAAFALGFLLLLLTLVLNMIALRVINKYKKKY